jgi:Cd2+/Zn2+-exporting ATPase
MTAAPAEVREESESREPPPTAALIATVLCAAFGLAGAGLMLAGASRPAQVACFAAACLAGGFRPTRAAIEDLFEGVLSVDLLMVLAAAGAALLGDWGEGAALLFLFSLSGTLEAYAMYRTTRSIDALIQLRPPEACRIVADGAEEKVPVEDLAVGDLVRVRPGERFPIDGTIEDGDTDADEATLTGESIPVAKAVGSQVFAGTINGRGSVTVRATHTVADTTLERIVRMVREAQAQKTPAQRLVESWQGPYVRTVLAATVLVFLGTWLIQGRDVGHAFYHAMVILVVSSPCAVVIGTPAVLLSAIARAARQGVLFKGGAHLETLGRADTIAFDKTGTITPGKPTVVAIWVPPGEDPDRLLRLAAAVERHSEHHLAAAVVAEARKREMEIPDAAAIEAHAGIGVHGRTGEDWVGVGREDLYSRHGTKIPPAVSEAAQRFRDDGATALLVVIDGPDRTTGGVIAVADRPRPEAASAIAALKRLGVRRVVILTGDHERVGRAVARQVGADEVMAGLMPDQKVAELKRLEQGGSTLAMVGDGVNDAPALASAPVGIAMGGAGTDAALEVADVVLMRDDLNALPFAVWLGRKARARVLENLVFGFAMIAVLITASFFSLPLWVGVLGHEGSTLLVVLNGLRLLWEKPGAALAGPPPATIAA